MPSAPTDQPQVDPVPAAPSAPVPDGRLARFGLALTGWTRRLPPRWQRALPPELVGYAILGLTTFLLDLALLATLRGGTTWPLPADITVAYVTAYAVNFVLNRTMNFRSHAPVRGQLAKFAVVTLCDYGLTLGVTTGLTALGLDFRVSRIIASVCVGVFTYIASRWWVFRDRL